MLFYCVFFTLFIFLTKLTNFIYLSVKTQKLKISQITEDLKASEHILILKYLRSASADTSKPIPKLSTMAHNYWIMNQFYLICWFQMQGVHCDFLSTMSHLFNHVFN